jgi:methyltransferase (TIGR00027 family)
MTAGPSELLQAGQPSRTALWVARLRAVHQLLDEPIVLADPFALPILGRETEAELRADPFQYNDPLSRTTRATVVLRSKFAEEEVGRAVAAGVRQYVLLGAGLDTYAFRHPHAAAGLRIFEVDHPSTQAWKRRLLAEAGLTPPEGLTFAPVDFERRTLAQGLAEAGFRADAPACFSWLGVAVYLTEASVMETLAFVAARPPGSSVVFDFRPPASMLDPIARATAEVMRRNAAALGEPWRSAFEPSALRERLLALGFGEAETFEPDELNRRYLSRRKDGLHAFVRLARARVRPHAGVDRKPSV